MAPLSCASDSSGCSRNDWASWHLVPATAFEAAMMGQLPLHRGDVCSGNWNGCYDTSAGNGGILAHGVDAIWCSMVSRSLAALFRTSCAGRTTTRPVDTRRSQSPVSAGGFGSGGTMWDSHHRNLRLRCRPFRFAGLRCKMILQPRRCSTRKSHASLVWTWEPTFQAEVRRHAQEYVKGLQSTTRRQVEDSQRLRDLVESGHHIKTEPSGTSSATQAPPPLSSTKASKSRSLR